MSCNIMTSVIFHIIHLLSNVNHFYKKFFKILLLLVTTTIIVQRLLQCCYYSVIVIVLQILQCCYYSVIVIVLQICIIALLLYLERDGGAPRDVRQSHSQEEPNVYLVSETAQLSVGLKITRVKTTEKCLMDFFQSPCNCKEKEKYNKASLAGFQLQSH